MAADTSIRKFLTVGPFTTSLTYVSQAEKKLNVEVVLLSVAPLEISFVLNGPTAKNQQRYQEPRSMEV